MSLTNQKKSLSVGSSVDRYFSNFSAMITEIGQLKVPQVKYVYWKCER